MPPAAAACNMAIHCSALGATWPRSTTISVSTSTPLCRCTVSSSSGCRSKDNTKCAPVAARSRRRGDRMIARRAFITLLGGATAAWPVAARAQQPAKVPTIGFLGAALPSSWGKWVAAFVQRLRELGWSEGRTIAIEYRWAEGRSERYDEIAAELVQSKVDV